MSGTAVDKNVFPDERKQDFASAVRDRCLSAAGLVIGSSDAKKIKITNTVDFSLLGVIYQKSTAEVDFTATTHDITAVAASIQEAVYLLSIVGDGTVTITKGTTATGSGEAVVPQTPAGGTPIGHLRLAVAAGSTDFNATSDELSAGHLTDTYTDLSVNARDYEA